MEETHSEKVTMLNEQDQGPPPQYNMQPGVPFQHVIIRQPPLTNPPKDYLVQAILVTVFCFWPVGIIAIIKAMDVQRAAASGDQYLAQISSQAARKMTYISFGIGIVSYILLTVFLVAYVIVVLKYLV